MMGGDGAGAGVAVTNRGDGGAAVGGMGVAGLAVGATWVGPASFAPFGVWPARKTSSTTFGQSGAGAWPVVAQTFANSTPSGTWKFTTGLPSRAASMKAFQIGAAVFVLVAPGIGRLSALPTQTPVTSWGV